MSIQTGFLNYMQLLANEVKEKSDQSNANFLKLLHTVFPGSEFSEPCTIRAEHGMIDAPAVTFSVGRYRFAFVYPDPTESGGGEVLKLYGEGRDWFEHLKTFYREALFSPTIHPQLYAWMRSNIEQLPTARLEFATQPPSAEPYPGVKPIYDDRGMELERSIG